jgi:hypothetical protein
MNLLTFNIALLLGWLLALAGGIILNTGAGLLLAGLLLIALTLFSARRFGLYLTGQNEDQQKDYS